MRFIILAGIFFFLSLVFAQRPELKSVSIARKLLSKADLDLNPTPWVNPPGAGSQSFPLFLGASPREIALGLPRKALPEIPVRLRKLATTQAQWLRQGLEMDSVEFEIWPALGGNGQLNWVFARWRRNADSEWHWLTGQKWKKRRQPATSEPILPLRLDPAKPEDQSAIFDDFLQFEDLYQLPLFGDCVWTTRNGAESVGAWFSPNDRERYRRLLSVDKRYIAYHLPQPARHNEKPVSFRIEVAHEKVSWSDEIRWLESDAAPKPVKKPLLIREWPKDFVDKYRRDVLIFAGETDAVFPKSGKMAKFIKRNSAQADHVLDRVVDYLEERYAQIGIETKRQRFTWREIPQSNLIAIIPGKKRGAPVIFADHFDSAFEEDTFEKDLKTRVACGGANDNATATAALMRAAEILKNKTPLHDIWLVHFTGEEYPADGLGAWHFLSEMLKTKQDIRAVVITDFIGYHRPNENIFQINPNSIGGSDGIAMMALDAASQLAPAWKASVQPRDLERNGVYQTDVAEFEYLGIPGILFNENLNYSDKPERADPHNHQSTDKSDTLDFRYATDITKVAIETIYRLADEKWSP